MLTIDRRSLLRLGTFGLGALAMPGAAQMMAARGFTHNVASGEPRADGVMLWTRYVPAGGAGRLDWQVSETEDFARVAAGGSVTAEAEHDFCVKPVAGGLAPGRRYFYRFVDSSGRFSPVGRTRTLPEGSTERFKLGVFSCSNLPFGWFNAYAHAAARDDIDLMVHLGDYLYEYGRSTYPSAEQALAGRVIEPAGEIVQLADYRLRYAAYRADPDLQRLHQMFPMVMMWDDHELTNNAWQNGAENHQPNEGDWAVRKATAERVYREWMPITDNAWESYEIGDLATIFRPETRATGRSEQLDLSAALAGQQDLGAALVAFRDGPWQDPARTILGAAQERWLGEGFARSTRAGKKWQVLAQQVIMGSVRLAPEIGGMLTPEASEQTRRTVGAGIAASRAGLPFNFDMWDGYPAARARLLRSALDANANLVVLSGDSHNAWAFDLDLDGTPAGVEFAGQSVTSPGYESYMTWVPPADLVRVTIGANPQLKWADFSRRGYLTVELTPERATGEFLFLDTIRDRSTTIAGRHAMSVTRGTNRLA
ncbi:alkaline phosphatase D family protein [Sphingosinicella sp. LHD-64]|uniref:alkaline phosphatase D family protein n=1 Tax=Sphingosinicella sp. LHD-64 TaxID=3072139 RepID=UPI00280E19E1|nr:alkaline phosphatase D family protein [Sphingosinicella sp. LHD-64]MDQ8755640.1 alkaline phosphatase D family protein [Sphingosinicella sp. LHD-64]